MKRKGKKAVVCYIFESALVVRGLNDKTYSSFYYYIFTMIYDMDTPVKTFDELTKRIQKHKNSADVKINVIYSKNYEI